MQIITDKRILITGSTGFIGRHLLDYLYSDKVHLYGNTKITTLKSRLSDIIGMKKEIDEFQPNVVVHLAAIPIIKPNSEHPDEIIQTNINGTFNLINILPQDCKVVFASTITVYGDKPHYLGKSYEDTTLSPTSVYAATKIACENLINIYSQQGKINGYSLRLCATVGKYSTHGIVHDFVRKLRSDSEFLEVLGDYPGSKKPFLYQTDVCDAIVKSINHDKETQEKTFNICSWSNLNVHEIARAVMDGINIHKEVKWLGSAANWKGDNKLIDCSNQKAETFLGWRPTIHPYDAIVQVVKEY